MIQASLLEEAGRVWVVAQFSCGKDVGPAHWSLVDAGRVPILVHGLGVFYRRFFDGEQDYYSRICGEHVFQSLTESTKPGTAHRTGIYLTKVEESAEESHFRLLRCSSNFSGPTVNFGTSDERVVKDLNDEADWIFANHAPLNHVLAQVYHNQPPEGGLLKQTKAKIKAHADKTKDMPRNGLMAFCTFYHRGELARLEPLKQDPYDLGHRGVSGLTRLAFSLKKDACSREGCDLPRAFTVTLYPDSVFLMPLSTNRLYQHEIKPGALGADLLPTRMGYVVRCSDREAVHAGGKTFLKGPEGERVQLERPTPEGMAQLRALYAEENITTDVIDYDKHGSIRFSMNDGDYAKPLRCDVYGVAGGDSADAGGGFRTFSLHPDANPFAELAASVVFEDVGKGRQGAVLVKPDARGRTPLVRTTAKFTQPAQHFGALTEHLAAEVGRRAGLGGTEFNNALVEVYGNAYSTMGFHSDQALDLEEGSAIALYSCYRDPDLAAVSHRALVVESKAPGGARFEIPLAHNSVVVFSLEANRLFRHKIVLRPDSREAPPDNSWLGITLRTSSTMVKYALAPEGENDDGCCPPRFDDDRPLTLADEGQRREFYAMRRRENEETDFEYPRDMVTYSISKGDLMPPSPAPVLSRQ